MSLGEMLCRRKMSFPPERAAEMSGQRRVEYCGTIHKQSPIEWPENFWHNQIKWMSPAIKTPGVWFSFSPSIFMVIEPVGPIAGQPPFPSLGNYSGLMTRRLLRERGLEVARIRGYQDTPILRYADSRNTGQMGSQGDRQRMSFAVLLCFCTSCHEVSCA